AGMVHGDIDGIMAGAVLLTAPILVIFVALQRNFIAGIAAGAIK
ncbi:carbohydrate ABC transporter permease, partial [Rhizobium leguminosarum]